MPRPERPLPSDDDELLRFAADLRMLREKAGRPTYRERSKVAHYSVTMLSEAASGKVAYTAAFHGTHLATSHGDAKIRLWDVTDPMRPRLDTTYSGHEFGVPALAFSPDGTYFASGGNDTTVRLWEVGAERAIARLCARKPAPLTSVQWEEHFPGVPYRQVCR